MERVRARCCLAVGAIALAMSATAVGAVAAPPRDLTVDLAPVAARVPMPHSSDPTLDEGGHNDPTPSPTDEPRHDEEMASQEPMDMGGHGAESSPTTAPDDGHGDEASPASVDEASPAPADGHEDDDTAGGHDDVDAAAAEGERPRGVVLGGFFAINGLVLGAAALTRRRDRAAAALKVRRTPSTARPDKDASR